MTPRVALALLLLAAPAAATTRTGVLETVVADTFDETGALVAQERAHVLRRGARTRHRVAPDDRYLPGATMRLRGTKTLDGTLVPQADARGVTVVKLPPQTPVLGPQHLVLLPVMTAARPATRTPAELEALSGGLVTAVAQESLGRASLTLHAEPWAVIEEPANWCDYGALVARAIAAHPTADYSARTTVVAVILPGAGRAEDVPPCYPVTGTGYAVIGPGTFRTPAGTRTLRTYRATEAHPGMLHELGHAFGLAHADAADCPTVTLDPAVCLDRDAGDRLSTMGGGLGSFHLLHRRQLGWLPAIDPHAPVVVTQAGTYTIAALTAAVPVHPRGLLLPRATVPPTTLAVETRFVEGLDRWYPDDWLRGVVLHAALYPLAFVNHAPTSTATHLVWPTVSRWTFDATLKLGASFTDYPWRLTPLARDYTARTVTVRVDDLRAVPTPATSPCPPWIGPAGATPPCPARTP